MSRAQAILVALAAAACLGASPGTWIHPEKDRAVGGEPENVSLSERGSLLLAPQSREILPGGSDEPASPMLWAATLDLRGSLFVGGGLGARVLRVDSRGTVEHFFESKDLGVRALAADVAGNVFVATFPTGRVYRVSSEEGATEVYFEPEERYLWALATDAFDRLYLASGEKGIVYVIGGPGEGAIFFDSDEPHITALASDPVGRILAGSAGRGFLYRIDGEGHAEVLLDTPLDEVSAIAVASDGTIYAAAIREPERRRPGRRDGRRDELTIEVTASDDDILEEAARGGRKIVLDLATLLPGEREDAERRPASSVYRIVPGRTPAEVWSSPDERVYALAFDSGSHLLMGTGPDGRLYRLEPDRSATLVQRYPAAQITALASGASGETYVLTSNPGRVYALESTPASSGTYLSPVRDAGAVAHWGTMRWDADLPQGTRIELVVRSGNTATPDGTWGRWSGPYDDPAGSALQVPPARYAQWRAELSRLRTGATPVLKAVSVTYLPENRPPAVMKVAVGKPGGPRPGGKSATEEKDAEQTEAESARAKRRWVTWRSSDPDGDPLRHAVSVRRSEDAGWRSLAENVKGPPFDLDPAELPEGRYVLKVEASDEEANGEPRSLEAEGRSDPFAVDHTPPVITPDRPEEEEGRVILSFQVRDSVSTVAGTAWALDRDGPWTTLTPEDGIPDTKVESYRSVLDASEAGRRLFLKASDASGNETILEVDLSGPR